MAEEEQASAVIKGFRRAIREMILPELREMRAELRAIRDQLDQMSFDSDEARHAPSHAPWTHTQRRFEQIEEQLNIYEDVQLLKKQLAQLRAQQLPSA